MIDNSVSSNGFPGSFAGEVPVVTNPPPQLATETVPRPSPRERLLAALAGLLPRNLRASNPPSGRTNSSSLYKGASRALGVTALLAVLAVGLLPGGLVWAQDAGTIEYPENGTGAVATYTAEDPEGTTITWTLEGDDALDFKISSAGVLTFAETPNYEAAADAGGNNVYNIMIIATDSSNATDTEDVTVEVTNVDEDGTLTLSSRQPVDGIELETELTDIDSIESDRTDLTDETWKWEKSTSRTSGWTVIEGATDAMYTPAPADVGNYLQATVTYTDPEGSGKSEMAVSDRKVLAKRSRNNAPVFRNADDEEIDAGTAITREVLENSVAGTNVGDPVAAYDAEGDVLTYTLSGTTGDALFDIDQATGQIMVGAETMLDFETVSPYTVDVTATGPGHGDNDSDTITVNITVTNVDEDPELTGMDSLRHAENTATDTAVGTYTASDDEDGALNLPTLTLSGTDASDFTLTDNNDGTYELAFKAVPDYEMAADAGRNNVYNITVTATDSDGQTDRKNVVVTVTNVEEDGTVTLSTLQPRVGIGVMATLTDLDGATTDVTWAWEAETAEDCSEVSTFTPDAAADDLEGGISGTYTPTSDDIGKCLRATASYTDPQGSDTAMSVLTDSDKPVEKDDTNKAPAFPDQDMETDGDQTDQERTVAENTAADQNIGAENIGAVAATDPNEDKLTYTLGGTDMASFSIDRGTGQLMTKAMLNKEAKDTYMVTVTATDPSGLSDTIKVTIKVTNVDEDPVITGGDTSVRYAENRTGAVETYTATDDEDDKARKAITWTLSGTDGADFMISAVGVLTFVETPDYEMAADAGENNVYNIMIIATDSSNATDTEDVTVEVTNVDEDGTLTLSSRQPVDGIELETELTDIDSIESDRTDLTDETWKWEKSTSRTSGWAVIDGATDAMYTPAPADVGNYLRATVTYTDPEGSGKSEMAVSDRKVLVKESRNNAPVFRNADDEEIDAGTAITREVLENSVAGTNVGDPVAAYDAEGHVLTYTLSGTTGDALFDIDQATGQIMVGAETMLDFETVSSYTVDVTATGPGHGDNDSDTITVNITVTNVDEDPELTGMDSLRHAENTATDTAVGTYTASDDEDGALNLPTLTLSGTDASDFTLTDNNDGTYELAFKAVPDYEMAADAGRNNVYNITVTATDSDGQTDRKNVVVTVTNVEEDGTVTLSTLQPRVGIGVMATLTDLDGATTDVTWAWEAETAEDCSEVSTFTPDAAADDLEGGISGTYTPTSDDIGKCLRATASYTDPQGSDTAMSVLTDSDQPVEKDDTNKAPAFPDQDMETDGDQTDQERTVAENTAADQNIGAENIGAVVATDPNEDNLTYTLGGTDMASFSIDRGTGQLMTKAMLNKEAKDTYMVTVTATDPSGLSDTIKVTIKVTNVDEDPVIMRAPDVNVAPEFASTTITREVAGEHGSGREHRHPGGGHGR